MALFKDTNDFADVYPLLRSAEWDMMKPFVELVEAEIMSGVVLGPTVYNALHAAYLASIADTPVAVPAPYAALLPKVRKVLAFLATYEAIPTLNVQFSGAGLTITETERVKAAPMWRTNQARTQVLLQAYGWMNQLILHLQANESVLTAWNEAPLRAQVRGSLLPDMRSVEPYTKLHGPWMLHQLRPALLNAQEEHVKPVLGDTAYDTLLAHVHATPSTVTADEQKLLHLIRPAMLHMALAESLDSLSLTMDNNGVWTWSMPSSGGMISGGQQPADNERRLGLKRDYQARAQAGFAKLRELVEPTTGATINTMPGNTGSVFFGG